MSTDGTNYLEAAASLFSVFTFERLIPLLTLLAMAFGFILVIVKAQRRRDFDWSEFLRDDKGKLSASRLFAFVCCMTTTWWLFVRTISGNITTWEVLLYTLAWSGSLVLLEAVKAWVSKGQPPSFPPPPEVPKP